LTASRPRIISERDETEKPVQNCSWWSWFHGKSWRIYISSMWL